MKFLKPPPPKSGLSKTYIPRTIMTGKSLDGKKIYKLHFVVYVQVHEDRNVTNTLEEKIQGEICLGPTGNLQGTYIYILLRSSKNITQRIFTKGTTPTIFMKPVAAMTLAEKHNKGIIF